MNNKYIIKVVLIILISSLAQAGKEPKNLKVLKFKTNKEITKYMKSVTKDLGVKCKYCHDMKDKSKDTPMKETARNFMTLVDYINNSFLQDSADLNSHDNTNVEKHQDTQISCWTCHRGNIEPEKKRPKK